MSSVHSRLQQENVVVSPKLSDNPWHPSLTSCISEMVLYIGRITSQTSLKSCMYVHPCAKIHGKSCVFAPWSCLEHLAPFVSSFQDGPRVNSRVCVEWSLLVCSWQKCVHKANFWFIHSSSYQEVRLCLFIRSAGPSKIAACNMYSWLTRAL